MKNEVYKPRTPPGANGSSLHYVAALAVFLKDLAAGICMSVGFGAKNLSVSALIGGGSGIDFTGIEETVRCD
jgi:hypothetical protein